MRRKPGALVPIEIDICLVALALSRSGVTEFHGYELAKSLREGAGQKLLTAYGTLYRALARLERMGLLASRWEASDIPARENRPGRRLYTLTGAGAEAARQHRRAALAEAASGRRRIVPA
jgi:PadR family transcriptional regulator